MAMSAEIDKKLPDTPLATHIGDIIVRLPPTSPASPSIPRTLPPLPAPPGLTLPDSRCSISVQNREGTQLRLAASQQKGKLIKSACHHLTTTRDYTPGQVCHSCQQPGCFGWLWACTEDVDRKLEDDISKGHYTTSDPVANVLLQNYQPALFSPSLRSRPNSLLSELTTSQLHSFDPSQLQTLLQQRKVAQSTARREQAYHRYGISLSTPLSSPSSSSSSSPFPPRDPRSPPVVSSSGLVAQSALHGGYISHSSIAAMQRVDDAEPWVPMAHEICGARFCQRCRRVLEERSWISFDGVVSGDAISAVTATGWGFGKDGGRPVGKVEVVINAGTRAVPVKREKQTTGPELLTRCIIPELEGENLEELERAEAEELTKLGLPFRKAIYSRRRERKRYEAWRRARQHKTLLSLPATAKGDDGELEVACRTPLPSPTCHEVLFLLRLGAEDDHDEDVVIEAEKTLGIRHEVDDNPVKVPEGLAVTEEAVEEGLPDIITQV